MARPSNSPPLWVRVLGHMRAEYNSETNWSPGEICLWLKVPTSMEASIRRVLHELSNDRGLLARSSRGRYCLADQAWRFAEERQHSLNDAPFPWERDIEKRRTWRCQRCGFESPWWCRAGQTQ